MPAKGPLAEFFSQYERFTYNHRRPATKEFHRLCKFQKWPPQGPAKREAQDKFKGALTRQFGQNYGIDSKNIGAWQVLCDRVGIKPIPHTLDECRDAVLSTHVNLVDLVHVHEKNGRVRRFKSEEALSTYTKTTNKIFPAENIETGDLLKHLLRHIFHPRAGY